MRISCRLDEVEMMLMNPWQREYLLKCADTMVKRTLNHQHLFILANKR